MSNLVPSFPTSLHLGLTTHLPGQKSQTQQHAAVVNRDQKLANRRRMQMAEDLPLHPSTLASRRSRGKAHDRVPMALEETGLTRWRPGAGGGGQAAGDRDGRRGTGTGGGGRGQVTAESQGTEAITHFRKQ